tara:strand:+ start:551 stop:913 length:363 start_codon:yes stop_codon:yes gene_type:complete
MKSCEPWFLAKKEKVPEDYFSVQMEIEQVEDPQGNRRCCADGTIPIAKVWVCDLIRGGVRIQSDLVWSHQPPMDVAIFQLPEEHFKRLMGRTKNKQDRLLNDSGAPLLPTNKILGNKFRY